MFKVNWVIHILDDENNGEKTEAFEIQIESVADEVCKLIMSVDELSESDLQEVEQIFDSVVEESLKAYNDKYKNMNFWYEYEVTPVLH